MGAWGVGGFANDTAGDWSWEFEHADLETGLKLITNALKFRLSDRIIHQESAETVAVAAAEMVAAINGHPMAYEDGFNDRSGSSSSQPSLPNPAALLGKLDHRARSTRNRPCQATHALTKCMPCQCAEYCPRDQSPDERKCSRMRWA